MKLDLMNLGPRCRFVAAAGCPDRLRAKLTVKEIAADPADTVSAVRGPLPGRADGDDAADDRGERAMNRRERRRGLSDVVEQCRRDPPRIIRMPRARETAGQCECDTEAVIAVDRRHRAPKLHLPGIENRLDPVRFGSKVPAMKEQVPDARCEARRPRARQRGHRSVSKRRNHRIIPCAARSLSESALSDEHRDNDSTYDFPRRRWSWRWL